MICCSGMGMVKKYLILFVTIFNEKHVINNFNNKRVNFSQ